MCGEDTHSILKAVVHFLPQQGPIDIFVHHNTLHAFEKSRFEDAVVEAGRMYGAEAFLPEQVYLQFYQSGRITSQDIEAALKSYLHAPLASRDTSYNEAIKCFLVNTPAVEGFQEVKWLLRESQTAVPRQGVAAKVLLDWHEMYFCFSSQGSPLRTVNRDAAESLRNFLRAIPRSPKIVEHERTILWAAALELVAQLWNDEELPICEDDHSILDEMINPILIRFCEEYLDLGFSHHLMPYRQEGMLACFLRLVDVAHFGIPAWLKPLMQSSQIHNFALGQAESLIEQTLAKRGVLPEARYTFLLREALSLRGWAGYIALVEQHPELLHGQQDEIRPRFSEYMAIRLLLSSCASQSSCFKAKVSEQERRGRDVAGLDRLYTRAFHVLRTFAAQGCASEFLQPTSETFDKVRYLLSINETTRRRLWHIAYENNLYVRALDALSTSRASQGSGSRPSAQFVFCIDDREESIRRYLEEQDVSFETFGTAGFFGVDANLAGMSGSTAPYCPVLIKPRHVIHEVPREGFEFDLDKYRRRQVRWFQISGYVARGTSSWIHSLVISLAGCLSLFPMLLGVLFPRYLRIFGDRLGGEASIPADLHQLRFDEEAMTDSDMPGYTHEEMAMRVGGVLKSIGLIRNFAQVVLFVGHGSSSRNNPLRSAYDCGACGGRPGRINARAFCLMANNPQVRALIRNLLQIEIPDSTHFVGAFHNTCTDEMEYFDTDRIPDSCQEIYAKVRQSLVEATRNNALERCRRFAQVGVRNSDEAAREVLARSNMLAEARPEYGHASNALCIVGPRSFSKALFLDRRAFLVSYESSIDRDASILLGILRAVVPVCGGINLEYLFSAMDNETYGAGSKLPHNVTSLVGIMNGTSSDLRTGLPLQMIEIHEPVRQLLVIVATQEQLERVVNSDPRIEQVFSGEWMRVVRADPIANLLEWRLANGEYYPYQPSNKPVPLITSLRDWCTGQSGNLDFGLLKNEEAQ